MVGHDLRCPECASFAADVDHSLNLDNCAAIKWTCELGHVIEWEVGKEVVVRQKVVSLGGKAYDAKVVEPPVADPPKAEVVAPAPVRGPYVRRKGSK